MLSLAGKLMFEQCLENVHFLSIFGAVIIDVQYFQDTGRVDTAILLPVM